MGIELICGDALGELRGLPDESVHCCVTSPPYLGLRDYGVSGQLGLEKTPEDYVGKMVEIFREVRRVLRNDGTLWLNLGDSYASGKGTCCNPGGGPKSYIQEKERYQLDRGNVVTLRESGLKPKDLIGIPWRVAFALQADGWWLRQDIIWSKFNPMPESVSDRCTKAHEYIFLLTKSAKYYYNAEAISEPAEYDGPNGSIKSPYGQGFTRSGNKYRKQRPSSEILNRGNQAGSVPWEGNSRNKRSVWSIATQPYPEAHFATFPEELPRLCILAGCPPGGTVMDPFCGSGTTGLVARKLGNHFIGIELNPAYIQLAKRRIHSIPKSLLVDAL